MKIFLSLCLMMACCSFVLAHEDSLIELKDGKLVGLPVQYQPAYLDLDNKVLQIRDKKLALPLCVLAYFPKSDQDKVSVSASWYHDLEIMPFYLNVRVNKPNEDVAFSILFNLETAELISITRIEHGSNYVGEDVAACIKEVKGLIKENPLGK